MALVVELQLFIRGKSTASLNQSKLESVHAGIKVVGMEPIFHKPLLWVEEHAAYRLMQTGRK